jgi:hypothetical protein
MLTVYIEARPHGPADQDAITHYVAENDAGEVLGVFGTQVEAIDWAKRQGYTALLARLPQLNDKRIPYHWRPV